MKFTMKDLIYYLINDKYETLNFVSRRSLLKDFKINKKALLKMQSTEDQINNLIEYLNIDRNLLNDDTLYKINEAIEHLEQFEDCIFYQSYDFSLIGYIEDDPFLLKMFYGNYLFCKLFFLLDSNRKKEAYTLRQNIIVRNFDKTDLVKLHLYDKFEFFYRSHKVFTKYKLEETELLSEKLFSVYLMQRGVMEASAGNLYDSVLHFEQSLVILNKYQNKNRTAICYYFFETALNNKVTSDYFDLAYKNTENSNFKYEISRVESVWSIICDWTFIKKNVKLDPSVILWVCINLSKNRSNEVYFYLMELSKNGVETKAYRKAFIQTIRTDKLSTLISEYNGRLQELKLLFQVLGKYLAFEKKDSKSLHFLKKANAIAYKV